MLEQPAVNVAVELEFIGRTPDDDHGVEDRSPRLYGPARGGGAIDGDEPRHRADLDLTPRRRVRAARVGDGTVPCAVGLIPRVRRLPGAEWLGGRDESGVGALDDIEGRIPPHGPCTRQPGAPGQVRMPSIWISDHVAVLA